MLEDDLIDFLREGPKIGEQVFRDRFGYCPRGLLRILTGTLIYKYRQRGLVAYRLMEDVFINDDDLDGLKLDDEDEQLIIDPFKDLNKDKEKTSLAEISKTDVDLMDSSETERNIDVELMNLDLDIRMAIMEKEMKPSEIKKLLKKPMDEIKEILFPKPKRKSFLKRIFSRS